MIWSNEQSLELIQLYKEKPLIWDPYEPKYFRKQLRLEAWNGIASWLGREVEDCKQKMLSLLASYRRERSKIRKSIQAGGDEEEIYQSCWFAYEALSFLGERSDRKRPIVKKQEGSNLSAKPTQSAKTPEPHEFHITKVEVTEETCSDISENNITDLLPDLSNNFTEVMDRKRSYDNTFQAMEEEPNKLQKMSEDNELGRNEFDVFCESLAIQLRKMPLERALICQEKLQSVMTQERLFQLTH